METNSAIQKGNGHAVATWTEEQTTLIKRTVCPQDTSNDELLLFLHVAKVSGLDPLRRQIHCTKRNGRLVIIADINGLQARAAKEPDYEGLLHSPVYKGEPFALVNGETVEHKANPLATGEPIGAWATVFRKGKKPFTAVVRFSEYNSGGGNWKTMPGVMIDKVAKSTALRLAYPEQLGGIYEGAEFDVSTEEAARDTAPRQTPPNMERVKPPSRTAEVAQILAERTGWTPDAPPPPSDDDAPPDAELPPSQEQADDAPVISFGSDKGKTPRQLDDKSLSWYGKVVTESVRDPSKAKFKAKNQALLNALVAEKARRNAQ